MRSRAGLLSLAILLALPTAAAAAGTTAPRGFDYAVPVQRSSPWPEMRRDSRNSGSSPIRARYRGDRPWAFRTGRGIFSTPVIGGDGTIYVGSADGSFYALSPAGKLRWRLRTGGIIDAAAAIGAYDRRLGTTPITIGSGDERLYHLRADRGRESRGRRIIWAFKPTEPPATGQLVNWWEGNVAIGPGGTIFAGNTGGGAYAINPDGTRRWVHQRGNSVWTTPAFGQGSEAGDTFWGSVDLYAFSLDPEGAQRWQTITLGYVTSSPALGVDGTVYIASFDGKLYALDPDTGVPSWFFQTDDHVYSSPALEAGAGGATRAIYIASADGSVYRVSPDGHLVWRYDTGDPIRSSPVLGRKPRGGGHIVYVGSSNGKLYALDSATGKRRWSFDTTPRDPELRDRNDLNGSPALGRRGVYIGGEHGRVWFVPYDYCMHRRDHRCDRAPGQEFGAELNRIFFVSPGGSTIASPARRTIPAATDIATRLIVRKSGLTEDAAMQALGSSDGLVQTDPPFPFTTQLSGDGHYLFVRPLGLLRPGTDYTLRIAAPWLANGIHIAGQEALGTDAGRVASTLRLRTAPSGGPMPLAVSRNRVSAFTISRLAVPLPPLLPSVNQIGFDSYDMIAGTLERTPPGRNGSGRVLLWVIGARRDARGNALPDPHGNFQFPLEGRYRGNTLLLGASNLNLEFSFGKVPLRQFDIRGQMGPDLRMRPGTSLYAEVTCSAVPNYSVQLQVAGVCNKQDTLAASGTLLTRRYDPAGSANRRPAGVTVGSLRLVRAEGEGDGAVVARLRLAPGVRYPAARHVGSILLTDARSGAIVPLTYREDTSVGRDGAGNLRRIRLLIPAGTELPPTLRAYVIGDVFPLAVRALR